MLTAAEVGIDGGSVLTGFLEYLANFLELWAPVDFREHLVGEQVAHLFFHV